MSGEARLALAALKPTLCAAIMDASSEPNISLDSLASRADAAVTARVEDRGSSLQSVIGPKQFQRELERADRRCYELEKENESLLAEQEQLHHQIRQLERLCADERAERERLAGLIQRDRSSVPAPPRTSPASLDVDEELRLARESVGRLLKDKLRLQEQCVNYEERILRQRKHFSALIARIRDRRASVRKILADGGNE